MQHLGLLAIVLMVAFGAFATLWQKPNKRQSFSQHVAKHPQLLLAFGVVFSLVTILYYTFLIGWLGPTLNLPGVYYWILSLAFLCQFVIAWLPADAGRTLFWHNIAAYLLALLMPVVAGLLYFAAINPSWLLSILVYVYFLTPLMLLFLYLFTNAKQNFLYFQIGYFSWFWLVMLAFTYS